MTSILGGIGLGVQSYCFREFSNERIVDALQECGLTRLEICRKHLNLEVAGEPERVLDLYRSSGISFNSYGINVFDNDEAKARAFFEFAVKAGIKVLGAKPKPDAFEMLGRLCYEYSVKLAIHNHGRNDPIYGTSSRLEEALAGAPEPIGLCLDTGWLIDANEDPVAAVHRFAGRIYGVHFKDFDYSESGERLEAALGEGNLDVTGVLRALKQTHFNGYASIEYEGEPNDPVPSIKRCVDALILADREA
ncbi:MAG: Sugar phosphate isomerase/epimerase [Paenibacillus sp.]|nr:Sugar phosphate isomerase/epimerase [Paenibacillus sp.]